ncbi:hypothetical protein BC940DRAFT_311640 [Gongronella butleri]|nr:hypothetical protein BC940DRAFT_311640 [Gongronella butleri]
MMDAMEAGPSVQLTQNQPTQPQEDPMHAVVAPWNDALDRLYKDIRHYQHPMNSSMIRCVKRKERADKMSTAHLQQRLARLSLAKQHQHQQHQGPQQLIDESRQQRTFSSSILPTLGSLAAANASSSSVHRSASSAAAPLTTKSAKTKLDRLRAHAAAHPPSSTTSTMSNGFASTSDTNRSAAGRWSYTGILDRMLFYTSG